VGDDCSWDRRGGKWEAHTQCWLNSSPEARERVIRNQEQESREQQKQEKPNFSKTKFTPLTDEDMVITEVDIDTPEVTPSIDEEEQELERMEDEEEKFVTLKTPIIPVKCLTFYDSVYLLIAARIHFYIYGPAGCGKSHIVEQSAHHFGMSFSSISLNVQTMPSTLLGYKDINGVYQGTDFRRVFEFGGVFLIDEMDNASGNLLTTLNSALANRFLQFPDGMVTMHPDCVVIATGNTTGRGKTAQYISRQTLDAATLDRFAYLSHDYDESLELALASGTVTEKKTTGKVEYVPCVDTNRRTKWATIIQAMRKNGKKHGLQVVVSYRPVVTGCKLLNHFEHSTLLEMLVLKGVDEDTKRKLMEGVYV
jgi:MoxR-like ATPase